MELPEILLSDIQSILHQARQKAFAAVNTAMVQAYWQIGKRIMQEEQQGKERADYGSFLIKQLSGQLSGEFGNGFSIANLKNFRQFYLTFPDLEKGYALRSQLTWTHYRLIMRVENTQARQYYLNEAAGQNWSTRALERNINTLYYERLISSTSKPSTGRLNDENQTPTDFIKDPYVFEFLNLAEATVQNERTLEAALINNLQHFLLELGKGFSFVGRQYRISSESSHFYCDLVFYNYILKCFVLFDLKTDKLNHENVGQMDMYVRMFDDLKRPEGDNPTIGIILCTAKDETIVKYSILNGSEQLFASKYRVVLPTEKELITEIEREKLAISLRQDTGV